MFSLTPLVQGGRVWRNPSPADRARQTELVENLRVVIRDSARQDLRLPGTGRNFEALQLPDDFEQPALAPRLRARREVLPVEQPAHEL